MLWFIWFGFMFLWIVWGLVCLLTEGALMVWNTMFPRRKVDVRKVMDYLHLNH